MAWFRRGSSLDTPVELSRPITISAGGALYTVTRGALRHLAEHPIFGPVVRGTDQGSVENGVYFIDCDGTLFRHILNYLRSGGGSPSRGASTPLAGAAVGPGGGDGRPVTGQTSVGGSGSEPELCLPEDFSEWAQLLTEARHLQLPDLAAQIASRYEYQRTLFARTLPMGVCVRWPTTVVLCGAGGSPASGSGAAGSVSASPTTVAVESATEGGFGSREGGAGPATTAAGKAERLARSALRVTVTPPLPSLEVTGDGRTVLYGPARTPVRDLDALVTLLLSAYGYRIDHWQEREGKVFLSLPTRGYT